MKAAVYQIAGSEIKLVEKYLSLAEAMLGMKNTPCPYGAKMCVVDDKFNIIENGNVLEVYDKKTKERIAAEYCETKGLADFTAKVLRDMGYEVHVN